MWRSWKSRIKGKYFDGQTKEECLALVPAEITEDHWKIVVDYWNTTKAKEISRRNKRNRGFLGPPHRTGRKSCANVRREMKNAGKPIDKMSVYIEMRTDKKGNPKDSEAAALFHAFDDALDNLTLDELASSEKRDEIFDTIMGPEGHGRLRTLGCGPTLSQFKSKSHTMLDDTYKEALRREVREEVLQDVSNMIAEKFASMSTHIEMLEPKLAALKGQGSN